MGENEVPTIEENELRETLTHTIYDLAMKYDELDRVKQDTIEDIIRLMDKREIEGQIKGYAKLRSWVSEYTSTEDEADIDGVLAIVKDLETELEQQLKSLEDKE